jgi:hypothetical protein
MQIVTKLQIPIHCQPPFMAFLPSLHHDVVVVVVVVAAVHHPLTVNIVLLLVGGNNAVFIGLPNLISNCDNQSNWA